MTSAKNFYIGPEGSLLAPAAMEIVERVGGRVTSADEAHAVLWFGHGEVLVNDSIRDATKWVQLPAAGVERWMARGEVVAGPVFTSMQGAFNGQVAEHALALILACAKHLMWYSRADEWLKEKVPRPRRLARATVAIVGAGGIGHELIRLLTPFAVRTIAVTRSGRPVEGADVSLPAENLHDALAAADYVVLAAPASEDNRALIGEAEFSRMPASAWLINVGRGAVVDTVALLTAVREGRIAGAAIDVTDPEPLPQGHPLWREPNILITPHVANPPDSYRADALARIEENVRRFLDGDELLGVIDRERGY